MFEGEHLVALYGKPFANDNNPGTTTDQFVSAFLTQHGDALGVDNVALALLNEINIRNDKFTVYTYTQYLESLPVYGSVVKIPVLLGATGKIGYVGINLSQPPPAPLPPDLLSAAQAVAVVDGSSTYGHLTTFQPATKVIFDAGGGSLHRAWEFVGYDDDEAYDFFVDTNTGQIITAFNIILNADVPGTVQGFVTPCCARDADDSPLCPEWSGVCPANGPAPGCVPATACPTTDPAHSCCCGAFNPNNPCSPDPAPVLLPGVQVSVYSSPANCATNPEGGTLLAQTYTNENGEYLFIDPLYLPNPKSPPTTIVSRLIGPSMTITNCGGTASCVADELVTCIPYTIPQPGQDAGQLIYNLPSGGQFGEYSTAQATAYAVAQTTHDWFKGLQPTCTAIDEPIELILNAPSVGSCNMQYYPHVNEIRGTGSFETTCRNPAFSTFLSHEYGHFIATEIVPIRTYLACGVLLNNLDFHEGVADTIASLSWGTECIFYDFEVPNACARNVDLNWPFAPCIATGYQAGLAIASAFWDTRKNLITTFAADPDPEGSAKAIIDPLFADFLFITDGLLDQSIIVEVLIIDDDDYDLSNGTPHYNEIIDAFVVQHLWDEPMSCDPGVTVSASWTGPLTTPVEGIDYVVHCEANPPNITLLTTQHNGTPVESWVLGRLPGGGGPLSLGTISADWLPPANRDISVSVGQNPGAPVRNLSIVDIPAQGSQNWSSVAVSLTGHLLVRAQAYGTVTSPNVGGQISGSVLGSAAAVVGAGIGLGASDPGDFIVGGTLGKLTLTSLPAGSLVSADRLVSNLVITESLAGNLSFGVIEDMINDLPVADNGRIEVQGGGVSSGSITISDRLAGATVTINGPYAGTITVKSVVNSLVDGVLSPHIRTGELTGTIVVTDTTVPLAGTIEIGTAQTQANVGFSGLIDVRSPVGNDGHIVVHGNVFSTGKIAILKGIIGSSGTVEANTLHGQLKIGDALAVPPVISPMNGRVDLAAFPSTGRIDIGGACGGDIFLAGDIEGDIDVDGELSPSANVYVNGHLTGTGSINVDGLMNGQIDFAGGTLSGSQMIFAGGVGGSGGLRLNSSYGGFDAQGVIRVGPTTGVPPITFDGFIHILGGAQTGGVLYGTITIRGCHATGDPLDICICGGLAPKGRVTIIQTGCVPQVTWGGSCMCQ